jgi:sodium:dicarboxylate symporter family protein
MQKNNPNWLMATLDAVGTSYVTLLKAAVIPLVFTAVVASISNLSQVTNAAHRYGTEVVLSYEDQS